MTNDHQKREARQSLWDHDGHHIPKKYRNKGKGRGKDRRLAQSDLEEWLRTPELDRQDAENAEVDAAWYCYVHGPCDRCKESEVKK